MLKSHVTFAPELNILEFTPVERELIPDMFYSIQDLERFREDERRRWERAIARRLQKMERKRQQEEEGAAAAAAEATLQKLEFSWSGESMLPTPASMSSPATEQNKPATAA